MIPLKNQIIQFSTFVIPKISFSNDYICLRKIIMKSFVITGSVLAAIAVILGAFGAHSLKEVLTEMQLNSYETGVKYQLVHSLGILLIGIMYHQTKIKLFKTAAILMFIGVLLFSFSIYLLSCKDLLHIESWTFLGPITPFGGLSLIVSWLFVIIAATKIK